MSRSTPGQAAAPAGPTGARRGRASLVALLGANAISMVGNVLTLTAIPWFVLETTGSAARTGVTAFFAVVPAVLAAFFGGTVVDRVGFKRVSIVADLASGLTVALVPLLYHTVGLAFWQLLVLVFLGALLDAPGGTGRRALLPDLAAAAGTRLERANGAAQSIERGAAMVGAPLAGVLILLLGASNVLWVDAATFAISAGLVAAMVPSSRPRAGPSPRRGYVGELREGLRYLGRDRLMRTIVIVVMLTNFLDGPLSPVILPVYANRVLGSPVSLGLLVGAFGAAALLGAVAYGMVGHRLPRRATFIAAFIAAGLPFWALATLPPLPVALAAMAAVGLAAGPINPLLATVAQERVPPALRGRVFGIVTAGAFAALPLGVLLAGYLVEWLGLRSTILVVAGGYLLVTVSLLVNPAIRQLRTADRA
jgi:MFS family permease